MQLYTMEFRQIAKYFLLQTDEPIDLDGETAKTDEALKQAALAKLTDEDKRVLGLK